MTDTGLFLGLNLLDLIIIAVALGIGVWGWRMGILRAGVALLAIVVGVFLAGAYHERVLIDLAISEAPSGLMKAVSFLVILVLVSVGGYVIGVFLRGLAALLLLGWADRAAGGVFGMLIGFLLIQAVFAIVVSAGLDDAHGLAGHSVIGWAMLENAPVVRALLPLEFDLAIQSFVAEVGQWRSTVDAVQGPIGGG